MSSDFFMKKKPMPVTDVDILKARDEVNKLASES